MKKLLVVFACFVVFVAKIKSDKFWDCVTTGENCSSPSSEESSSSSEEDDDDAVGDPISDDEIKESKKLKITEPEEDPTQQDTENFEGDIRDMDAETLRGYAKDAGEIRNHFEKMKETDPEGHMDITGLNLDGDIWLNAIKAKHKLWQKGQIPYWISDHYNSYERKVIASAMADFHRYTCIRFIWRTWEDDFIHIAPFTRCWSHVGKQGGRQYLSLGRGCVHKGTVLHELMHAAGFFHEQSRTDRNSYVTINWNNIHNNLKYNFERYGTDKITHLGTNYDYDSIMHYKEYAFSKNGRPTIVPTRNVKIGQRNHLSKNDILQLKELYPCTGKCSNKRSWCNYHWLENYCYCGWIQSSCPKACNLC